METAADLRRKADALVKQGRYAEAAEAYRKEAAIYRRNGDTEGAKVEEEKAARWSSSVRLFAHLPDYRPPGPVSTFFNRAKHEPVYGCFIGAFLDRDERLGRGFTSNSQLHRDPDAFARLTDKKLASAFCYVAYGRPFPTGWVSRLREQGVAPHIAWEPNSGLDLVQDDQYLGDFARQAGRADCPIFLRYASEMNGDWTRYGGDPVRYKQKWQLVHRVMAREAPNVAMVWCVNSIPERPIPSFYPGDAFVDWVGVNLYSVPFYDNLITRVGLYANPADQVRYVYNLYAMKKPIMICEYGASHVSKVDGRDRSAWAAKKIAEMYGALPRLYPRVKMIDIFDNDNLKYADASRQLNNYSVTDSEIVRNAYAHAVAPNYFLSDLPEFSTPGMAAPTAIVTLNDGKKAAPPVRVPRGILRVSSWARTWADDFSVAYFVDGKEIIAVTEHGPREVSLPLQTPGPHRITAVVKDTKNRVQARTEAQIIIV